MCEARSIRWGREAFGGDAMKRSISADSTTIGSLQWIVEFPIAGDGGGDPFEGREIPASFRRANYAGRCILVAGNVGVPDVRYLDNP